jgi:hypothetical protein
MRIVRHSILVIGAALAAMQFIPFKRAAQAAVIPAHTIEASLDVPKPVEKILNNSCKDCHSNETRLPWYGKVAPLSWMIAGDVERARHAMNLSEWSVQLGSRPNAAVGTLMAACAGVEARRMPPAAYRRMHPDARLDQAQVDTLCGWAATQSHFLRKQAASRRTLALNR